MTRDASLADDPTDEVPRGLILLMAAACAVVVANIYYVQPIVGIVSRDYGLSVAMSGLLVTVTQLGYAAGLLFIVPLGDIVENRTLIVVTLAVLVAALIVAVVAPSAGIFLTASLAIGIAASTVQVIVPFAGHLAADATRGRVVGSVVSGLLLGIMLSRPAASFAAHLAGARAIFAISMVATTGIALILALRLPRRRPEGMPYLHVLASLLPLLRDTPVLQRRAAYQAAMFGCFSLFWTAVPLLLEGPTFRFSQVGIGLFALVGAGGAIASPFAGRAADAGHTRLVTGAALIAAILSFPAAALGAARHSVAILVVAAFVLDAAVAMSLVTGQRAIFALGAAARGRLNGLFLAMFFLGGAFGSFAAGIAYAHGGWTAACVVGACLPALALAYWATDRGTRDLD
ncbi:MAG: MFS transporter [Caulobacteraceae bacterium]|nr:MFS transporter [Caulobacter sp.]